MTEASAAAYFSGPEYAAKIEAARKTPFAENYARTFLDAPPRTGVRAAESRAASPR